MFRRLLSVGTWNVWTLSGLGKGEQLAIEMEHNWLVVVGVTETHLSGTGVQTLHESSAQ